MMLGQQNWLFCIILFIYAAAPVIVQWTETDSIINVERF